MEKWSPLYGTAVAVTPDAAATAGTGHDFARSNHQHGVATYSSTPAVVGATGAAGTSGFAPARGDHTHALGIVTTRGDIIVRDATVPARLALGASGTVLTSDGTDLVYATPTAAVSFTTLAKWSTGDSGTPTGPAGGGLAGLYPNPTVVAGAIDHNSLLNLTVGDPHTQYYLEDNDLIFSDIGKVIKWVDGGTAKYVSLSGPAAVTVSDKVITLPNVSGELIITGALTQTMAGTKRFSGTLVILSGAELSAGVGTDVNFAGSVLFSSRVDLNSGFNATSDYPFYVTGGLQMTIAADALTFENGAVDTGLGWATSGQLDFAVGATNEMRLTADNLTFEAGATDVSLNWTTSGQLDFQVAAASEMRLTANTLTFENGATDTGLGWATSGQLDFAVGATNEMSLTADVLTFEAGATDVGLGWATSGQLDFRVGSTAEMRLTADNLTFEAGATDVSLNWTTSGQLDFQVAAASEMRLTANTLTFENGATDTSLGWGTSGQLDFSVGATTEMSLTADTLTFNNGALDTAISWANNGTLELLTNGSTRVAIALGQMLSNEVIFAAVGIQIEGTTIPAAVNNWGMLWYQAATQAMCTADIGEGATVGTYLVRSKAVQTASVTVADTTAATETTLASVAGSMAIPGGAAYTSLAVGRALRIRAWGLLTTGASNPAMTIQIRYGPLTTGVSLASTGSITPATGLTDALWRMEVDVAVRAITSSGSCFSQGEFEIYTAATTKVPYPMKNTAATSIDCATTTAANTNLQFAVTYATNPASTNTITCTNLTVEELQ